MSMFRFDNQSTEVKKAMLQRRAKTIAYLADTLVASTDPELACEGRALLRSAAFFYTKAGEETKAKQVTATVEQLSRIARQNKIRHRTGVGK